MPDVNGCGDLLASVVRRRLVKAFDASIKPHVLPVSSLDLLMQGIRVSMFCIYPRPTTGGFDDVVAAFEAGLPSLLNHFFPFAGRIATNRSSGVPEIHCSNQGAELVVGKAGVPLASLDYGTMSESVRRTQLPYGQDVALSVQVVSFACGGFTVAWCTSHLLVDGSALSLLVGAWSELARSGTLAPGSRPNHDRSVFQPRAPPSYSATLDEAFTPLDGGRQVNVLTTEQSFVERLYYIVAFRHRAAPRGSEPRRPARHTRPGGLGLPLEAPRRRRGHRRRALPPETVGGWAPTVAGRRAGATRRDAQLRRQRRRVLRTGGERAGGHADAAARRGSHGARGDGDLDAGVRRDGGAPPGAVDWAEEHKTQRYVETATLGLGSPTLGVTAFASFPLDTDFGFGFGFGHAAMAMPTAEPGARQCSGYVQIVARPWDDGSWIASAFVWPQLAAALESDEPRIFRPVTAEYLGLFPSQVQRCRF